MVRLKSLHVGDRFFYQGEEYEIFIFTGIGAKNVMCLNLRSKVTIKISAETEVEKIAGI